MKIERSGIIKSELKGDTELDVVGMIFAMFQETAVDWYLWLLNLVHILHTV